MGNIRKLKKSEFGTFADMLLDAFPGMDLKGEEGKKKLIAWFTDLHKKGSNSFALGHFENGKMTGGMRYIDFKMTFLDRHINAGGLGIVAVGLLDKKKHVARDMVRAFIDYYEKKNTYVTLLYPFRPDFYRRMGYGLSTPIYNHRINTAAIPDRGNKDNVRFLTIKDAEAMLDCHNTFVDANNGMIRMNLNEMTRILKGPYKIIASFRKKKLGAFAVFNFKKVSDTTFIKNDINVLLMTSNDPDCLMDLFSFFHVQKDQAEAVRIMKQEHSLIYTLIDPRGAEGEVIEPVSHICGKWGMGIMIRITQPEKFLRQLAKHNFNNSNLSIRFNINDDFLSRKHDFTITMKNGYISKNTKPQCTVNIDTAEFSSMLSGAVTFRELYDKGAAQVNDRRYADEVSRTFFYHQKPVCETQF